MQLDIAAVYALVIIPALLNNSETVLRATAMISNDI